MALQGFWRAFARYVILVAFLAQLAFISAYLCSAAGFDLFRHVRRGRPHEHAPHVALKEQLLVPDRAESHSITRGSGLSLRHVIQHGAGQPGPRSRRLDVSPERAVRLGSDSLVGPFRIRTQHIGIAKPLVSRNQLLLESSWELHDTEAPDVTDKDTLINLAWMSEDAYKPDPSDPEWVDIGDRYNNSIHFGWDDNGIRGHVFSDDSNSTIIISLKGTTVAVYEGNGTSVRDKENDNLFGSCCCGQGGPYLWRSVCQCKSDAYTCDATCVKKELRQPSRYYEGVLELYDEVIQLYPTANVITVGHSLGGVLASLIGIEHGVPSVTFEAYPQALAARRLGLPVDEITELGRMRRNTGGFHFGHSADPIYMGTCNSASSFCSIAGYAFETTCHTGKRCVYDVVKDWGWRQSTNTHRLRYAINNVYSKYDTAAPCEDEDIDCTDCYLWKFENGTHSTTSSIGSTTSRTRTATCETPGWWGCNDETTTPPTTTAETTTTTTSTCKTPGWFGCKDETTSGEATTTITTTATCTSYGWFGRCLDPTPTTTTTTAEAAYWRQHPTPTQTNA